MANYPNYNGYNPMANPQGSYNNFQNPYGNYQNANMGIGGQNNYVLPQQQQLQNTFAYVNGVEGAKGYLLAPNTQAVLFDSDGSYFNFTQVRIIFKDNIAKVTTSTLNIYRKINFIIFNYFIFIIINHEFLKW